jgi:uncharacterized OsmC-like protein
MIKTSENLLESCGKPLIFRVDNADTIEHFAPDVRKGEAIRTSVRSLTEFQKEALVTSHRTGLTWRMASDEGKYLMGHDFAPAPLAYLTVGMVASYMNELLALAKLRGIELGRVRLIQDNYYSMEGSMQKGTMQAGADHVDLEVQVESDADRQALMALAMDATIASPLNGLMCGKKESLFTLTHNGQEIKTAKALPVGTPAEPDIAGQAEKANIAPGDWDRVLVRGPVTPKSALTDSKSGSSLTDHQSRLLHLRGICTLREDGVKVIEQQLFNPLGSIFYFLSDEGEKDGGQGRAPDAASYISAGIGFCFMTQFGRYAKMMKSDLQQYRIIQHSHFSLGGASAGTGKAGEADPLETHVHLVSGEDDDFARHILDMSEQTCFLHAFCRTDLKAKTRLAPYSG